MTISDEVLTAAHISEPELRQEIALALFQKEQSSGKPTCY